MKYAIYIIGLVMLAGIVSANISLIYDLNTAAASGQIIYTTTNLTIYYVNGSGMGVTNETDPIYSAERNELISNASKGATAYSWGNHAGEGYFDNINDFTGSLTNDKYCKYDSTGTTINCTFDAATSETDPIFSAIRGELVENATNGSIAYSWGDHGLEGYIKDGNTLWNNLYGFVNESEVNITITDFLQYTYYNVSSYSLHSGTTTDSLDDVKTYNESDMRISEKAGSPALDARFNFTGISDFSAIIIRLKTALNTQPTSIELYNYDDADWESYMSYTTIDDYSVYTLNVFDPTEHIQGGIVQLRLYQSAAGNTNHKHDIEWITLVDGVSIFSAAESDPLSVHISDLSAEFYFDSELHINMTKLNISESQIYDLQAYLTGELDPKVTSELLQNASQGATAYSWGNHANAGYYNTEGDLTALLNDNYLNTTPDNFTIDGGFSGTWGGGISFISTGSILMDGDLLIGGDILSVDAASVNGTIIPNVHNMYDLGSDDYQWQDLFVNGISDLGVVYATDLRIGAMDINEYIQGKESGSGVIDFNESGTGLTLYSPNNITMKSQFIPFADNTYSLGTNTREWKNAYFDGVVYTDGLYNDGNLIVSGETNITGALYTTGDVYVGTTAGDHYITFRATAGFTEQLFWDNTNTKFSFTDDLTAQGFASSEDIYSVGAGDDLWLGTATQGSALFRAYADGKTNVVNLTATTFVTGNDIIASDDLTGDQIYMGDYLYHSGDTDTYIYTESDIINLNAGGVEMLELNEGTIDQIYVRSPLNFVNEPANDHEGNAIIVDGTAGATLAVGDLVYLKDDREWYKTDADAEATSINMIGIVYGGTCTDGNACSILTYGVFRDDTYAWTEEGEPMYISTVVGTFNATRPSGTGDYVRVVGYALTDDAIYFNPGSAWVVVP